MEIFSKAFCPDPDTDNFTIRVSQELWEEAIREELGNRVFLRIIHPDGLSDWIAPMGAPVYDDSSHPKIYLPLWMMDTAHLVDGLLTRIDFLSEEAFPAATHIVFKVIDSTFYNSDVKEELEKALSAIGVIRQHSILQIPVESLNGYSVDVFISKTEPAEVVLCQGEEVTVEFEEPVDYVDSSPPRPPTPVPDHTEDFQSLLSPDLLQAHQPLIGFQAFQGAGHTLGSSNNGSAMPSWRVGLPIPCPCRGPRST